MGKKKEGSARQTVGLRLPTEKAEEFVKACAIAGYSISSVLKSFVITFLEAKPRERKIMVGLGIKDFITLVRWPDEREGNNL